jgi:polyisoprenoid-binding protein YceI
VGSIPSWRASEASTKARRREPGFLATAKINRHDFGVSWNDELPRGGIVVGHDVYLTIDAEAILDD